MSSHHRRSLALALLALALAGCAAGPESTDATTTPRTAPSEPTTPVTQPNPSVTPPPTAVDVPSFVDLRTGETTPLPDGMPTTGRAYAVSPDGTMVASSPCCHAPNPVWVANIDGTGATAIPDVPVHTIVVDPLDNQRLYVGTDIGVFVSIDGGANWARENTGFANVIVAKLTIKNTAPRYIYAFTHGRSLFRAPL